MMRRIIEDTETGGLEAMLGKNVMFICAVYIYTGKLVGVNDDHVELEDAKLVYETGEWTASEWGDAQPLPSPWRVQTANVESWGAAKC